MRFSGVGLFFCAPWWTSFTILGGSRKESRKLSTDYRVLSWGSGNRSDTFADQCEPGTLESEEKNPVLHWGSYMDRVCRNCARGRKIRVPETVR